jgi:hypothetical protein
MAITAKVMATLARKATVRVEAVAAACSTKGS